MSELKNKKRPKHSGIIVEFHQSKRAPLHLTLRETQCLQHILHGLTLKDTAQQISLSVRTVEFYFSNIKKKMECTKKSEVITLLHESDFFSKIKNNY